MGMYLTSNKKNTIQMKKLYQQKLIHVSRRPKKWSSFKKAEIKKEISSTVWRNARTKSKQSVLISGKAGGFLKLAVRSTFELKQFLNSEIRILAAKKGYVLP